MGLFDIPLFESWAFVTAALCSSLPCPILQSALKVACITCSI
jgi:hypothetical protein